MSLSVIKSEMAVRDVEEIVSYLDRRNPTAAERLADKIDEQCERLGHSPAMGRLRDDLAEGVRTVVVQGFVIFFRATADTVYILRVLHGSRDIAAVLRKEGGLWE